MIEEEVPEEREDSESEEEQIVVMREEEQIDPEAEAEFDREFERMMAESLDSRKFERKTQFDVPLPIRKVQRMPAGEPLDEEIDSGAETPPNPNPKMAFSLMTKKGNRPQVTSFSFATCSVVEFRWLTTPADTNDRTTLRFQLRRLNEIPTGGRTRRATPHQEPSLEL